MIIAKTNPAFTAQENTFEVATQSRPYQRILVFLDGGHTAEQALPTAIDLAQAHNASMTVIGRGGAGRAAYIEEKCRQLSYQGIDAHGYVVSSDIDRLTTWLVESEKADAVVMVQETAGWFGRLFNGHVAATLDANTQADIITV